MLLLHRQRLVDRAELPQRLGARRRSWPTLAFFSFLTHFNAIIRGVIDLRDLVFFVSVMALCLFANAIIVDLKKAD